jgi:hypothetical protein
VYHGRWKEGALYTCRSMRQTAHRKCVALWV